MSIGKNTKTLTSGLCPVTGFFFFFFNLSWILAQLLFIWK